MPGLTNIKKKEIFGSRKIYKVTLSVRWTTTLRTTVTDSLLFTAKKKSMHSMKKWQDGYWHFVNNLPFCLDHTMGYAIWVFFYLSLLLAQDLFFGMGVGDTCLPFFHLISFFNSTQMTHVLIYIISNNHDFFYTCFFPWSLFLSNEHQS